MRLESGVLCVLAVAGWGVAAAGVISGSSSASSASSGHHQLLLEGHNQESHDIHHEEPKPYKFGYGVKDEHHGLDFDQQESSDGHTVTGQYKVHLPDGRTQVVTYTADWKNGYHANVAYEGEAAHPKVEAHQVHQLHQAPAHGWAAVSGGGEHSLGAEYSGSSYSSRSSDHAA